MTGFAEIVKFDYTGNKRKPINVSVPLFVFFFFFFFFFACSESKSDLCPVTCYNRRLISRGWKLRGGGRPRHSSRCVYLCTFYLLTKFSPVSLTPVGNETVSLSLKTCLKVVTREMLILDLSDEIIHFMP